MLTPDNYKDHNLENRVINWNQLKSFQLTENLLEIATVMSNRNIIEIEIENINSTPAVTIDKTEMVWHCYLCGHFWSGHDKTNPEPPDRCAKCGKPNYKQPKFLGFHDPSCPRCKKKTESILQLSEDLRSKMK